MRFVDNDMRIINPYIRVVWIVAVGNELKVANPDNIAPLFRCHIVENQTIKSSH